MFIKDLTLEQLKVGVYDNMIEMENLKRSNDILNNEINRRKEEMSKIIKESKKNDNTGNQAVQGQPKKA